MADYDIGGERVIGGTDAYPDGGSFGRHETGGNWTLGSEIYLGQGLAEEDDFINTLKAANAYSDSETQATDCLWFTSAESDDGTVYFGIQAIYGWQTPPPPFEAPQFGIQTVLFYTSDSESLDGDYELITSTGIGWQADHAGIWFQCYEQQYIEEGVLKSHPYIALGGRQRFGDPISYDECQEHLIENREDYATLASIPLRTPSGEWIIKETAPDDSIPGGGNGDWDNDSDIIPWPGLPTLGAADSGFLAVYNPSTLEMQAFGDYLWSDFDSVWQNISKYQTNMLDLIVSLSVVPVAPIIGENIPLKIGGKSVGVSMAPVQSQYMAVDCGSYSLSEYYGSSLDYGPYTKIHIFLPYVGVRELKTDEVMDGTVSVRYNIDLVSGACVAMVRCQRHGLDAVLYQFEGNMGMQIPLTGRDFVPMYSSLAKTVMGAAGGVASGGAVGAAGGLADAAINVMSMKPSVQRSGSLTANAGHLGIHSPYLIIERPIQSYPSDANTYYGYPCNQTKRISQCHGYTEAEADILDISCTVEEMQMIHDALKSGIIC